MITRIQGDLFNNVKQINSQVIIPHVCNNLGAWGAGFVIPLGKHYPKARDKYLEWSKEKDFKIGFTQFVEVAPNVTIANMVAQDGITSGSTGDRSRVVDRPLRYDHLVSCMKQVAVYADEVVNFTKGSMPTIHCPKFGSGLAGGNWDFIEYLIEDIWNKNGLNVVVYTYG